MSTYTVFVERAGSGEGWGAWAPDLGVYATGDTREATIATAREAVAAHLAILEADGTPPPAPTATAVAVAAP